MRNISIPVVPKSVRSDFWDNAKGILIILVVLGHILEHFHLSPISFEEQVVHDYIYIFHMPLFILISGYFLRKSRKNPLKKIPKFIFLILLMALLYACLSLMHGDGLGLRLGEPQYGLWFLQFMVYSYVVAWFVTHLQNRKPVLFLFVTLLASLIAGMDDSINHTWTTSRTFYFMPFLITGMCLNIDTILSIIRKHKTWCILICLFSLVTVYHLQFSNWYAVDIFYGKEGYKSLEYSYLFGMFIRCMTYIWSITLALAVLGLIPLKKNKLLATIGKETLNIYLVHVFILGAILPIVEKNFPYLDASILLIIFTLLIIVSCIFVVKIHHKLSQLRQKC